jgi:hypothetical protein
MRKDVLPNPPTGYKGGLGGVDHLAQGRTHAGRKKLSQEFVVRVEQRDGAVVGHEFPWAIPFVQEDCAAITLRRRELGLSSMVEEGFIEHLHQLHPQHVPEGAVELSRQAIHTRPLPTGEGSKCGHALLQRDNPGGIGARTCSLTLLFQPTFRVQEELVLGCAACWAFAVKAVRGVSREGGGDHINSGPSLLGAIAEGQRRVGGARELYGAKGRVHSPLAG